MSTLLKTLENFNIKFERIKEDLNKCFSNVCLNHNNIKYKELTKEYLELRPFAEKYIQYCKLLKDKANTEELKLSDDNDIKKIATIEYEELLNQQLKIEQEIKKLFINTDTNINKNVIVEIRAGTGGLEASLFVGDLYRMYIKFIERNKWKYEVLTSVSTGLGGYKEVIFEVKGHNVWKFFKFEKGVHRVQRIPLTEATGRVHTSTVTVAVLPEVQNIDIEIKTEDIRIDTYRASGAGGQHVNKTDSAIRITHIPTGLVVTCQDERSQIKNKSKALKILLSKLYAKQNLDTEQKLSHERKQQIGAGNRAEKIRTYNFAQNRVTDHRLKYTIYGIEDIMDGNLSKLINKLIQNVQ
ncbi:MAG: peptide chain release factor 1 [Endomicrobium sp.]|jgi:peptide chain release factor 1|nr:peptide chain release factor 1 [Endomicrobium sp.]